ncbi:MAG: TrmH family RNA methyltransferase [Breznakia sp.]
MEITSTQNEKVKLWHKYHQKKYRDRDHCFLVEGEHLLEEALKAQVLQVLLIRKHSKIPFDFGGEIYIVSDAVMNKLSLHVSKVSYMGVVRKTKVMVKNPTHILLLDDVQDPGNVGTLLRSAYSFGFDSVYMSEKCADIYNEKVIASSQGALFYLHIERLCLKTKIESLKANDFCICATALMDAKPLSVFSKEKKIALILGNEGSGVNTSLMKKSNANIKIETIRFESLNVAIAGSICMYYFRKE